MKRTWLKFVSVAALLAATTAACDEWTTWDDMFKRTSVGSTNRGWTGGDGAMSAELPNGRAFWIFGDSYITSYSAEGYRPQLAVSDTMTLTVSTFGNTIAIQDDQTAPSASGITFYARSPAAGATTDEQCINATNSTSGDISINSLPSTNAIYQQYFNHAKLGLPTQSTCRHLWPLGVECIDCNNGSSGRLLISFYEWESCTAGTTDCNGGIRTVGNAIARFKNLGAAPSSWQLDGATIYNTRTSDSILWGVDFLKDTDGKIYVYGYKPTTDELVVMRTTNAGFPDSGSWEGWRGTGQWGTTGTLKGVAKYLGGGVLSVDRVTRGSTSAYLLVHSQAGRNTRVSVRVTTSANGSNSAAAWPDPTPSTPRLELASIDSSTAWNQLFWAQNSTCVDYSSGPIPNYDACAVAYHGQAHAWAATTDANGTLGIPISFIPRWGPNPYYDPNATEGPNSLIYGEQDAQYYRPKFALLDLSKLRPWCTSDCWEGIARDYSRRAVGAQTANYQYDVRWATKFYARLTRVSGSANVSLQFYNNLTPVSSMTCGAETSTTRLCYVDRPANANWVNVAVSGSATDVYTLRIHYAGES